MIDKMARGGCNVTHSSHCAPFGTSTHEQVHRPFLGSNFDWSKKNDVGPFAQKDSGQLPLPTLLLPIFLVMQLKNLRHCRYNTHWIRQGPFILDYTKKIRKHLKMQSRVCPFSSSFLLSLEVRDNDDGSLAEDRMAVSIRHFNLPIGRNLFGKSP